MNRYLPRLVLMKCVCLVFFLAPQDMSFASSAARVALFENRHPWDSRRNEELLEENYISYDTYRSTHIGAIDLSGYEKVIFASDQPDNFYYALSNHIEWFEAYVKAGGTLEMHLAADIDGALGGLALPGSLEVTLDTYDNVYIENEAHPILNTPHVVREGSLDGWRNSTHGYFSRIPADADVIVRIQRDDWPACVSINLEKGTILSTMQCIEWKLSSRNFHENIIMYFPQELTYPDIQITPQNFQTMLYPNQVATRDLQIFNAGDGELRVFFSEVPVLPGLLNNAKIISLGNHCADRSAHHRGIYDNIGSEPLPIEAIGDVISSIPFPPAIGLINGLAWGDSALWASDIANKIIFKLNPNTGVILDQFLASQKPADLAHDGNFLYLYDFGNEKIYKFNPNNGIMVDSFQDPLGAGEGLTCDGTYLWRGSDSLIVKMDMFGNMLATVPGPGMNCDGLAWGCGTLWFNADDGTILQIDPGSGMIVRSFSAPDSAVGNGLAFDGQYLRFDDSAARKIYTLESDCQGDLPWLTVNPMKTVVPPNASATVSLEFDTHGLTSGIYAGNLNLSSNDPEEPEFTIPVNLTVEPDSGCEPPFIKVAEANGLAGSEIILNILIEENPTPIDAFGFKLSFPTEKLSVKSVEKGELCQHFGFFEAKTDKDGNLIIGGFDMNSITANSKGGLVQVFLDVVACQPGEQDLITLSELKDDLVGFNICNGTFSCEPGCLRGDVNMDLRLTAADALCAFHVYLYNADLAAVECQNACVLSSSDANCDELITPVDGHTIFTAYLRGELPPLECPSLARSQLTKVGDEIVITVGNVTAMRNAKIEVPVFFENVIDLSAFGFKIDYVTDDLTFIQLNKSDLTSDWPALDGIENTPGQITVGGFNFLPLSESSGKLLSLVYQIRETENQETVISISNPVDDFQNAVTVPGTVKILTAGVQPVAAAQKPTEYKLEQNFPNPFNLQTRIHFELPETAEVQLAIYNSLGQVVRTWAALQYPAGRYLIYWDGLDEHGQAVPSGIYICQLKTDRFMEKMKMLVVK